MGPVRASNVERARWRDLCREALAQHIATRLRVTVEPSEVRLKPGLDTAYRWKIVPGKEHLLAHLFSKSFSEHSVSAYKELYAGVGKVFEAVAPTDEMAHAVQEIEGLVHFRPSMAQGVDMSFSAQIARLEDENARLSMHAEEVTKQLSAEARRRQEAEATVEQLAEVNQRLREQYDEASLLAESYVRARQKLLQDLSAVLPVLEEMKQGLSTSSSEVEPWHKTRSSAGQTDKDNML